MSDKKKKNKTGEIISLMVEVEKKNPKMLMTEFVELYLKGKKNVR